MMALWFFMFTKEQLQNLLALINRANITASEASTVVQLQIKLGEEIKKLTPSKEDEKDSK